MSRFPTNPHDTIQTLRAEIEALRKERDELVAELEKALPWVVTQTVACNGLKCREPVCLSCTDEVEAEANAQEACEAYSSGKKALAKVKERK